MAAISALMTLFRTGDHILCSDDLYGGTYRLFEKLLRPYGLSFDYVDMGDPAAVRKKILRKTKALFIETPTNPLMKIADLKEAAKIGREKGILTVVDNTFMSPCSSGRWPWGSTWSSTAPRSSWEGTTT